MKTLVKILTLVSLLSSCNQKEFFELETPPEFPWKSVQDFEMAVVYPYNQAFFQGWGGGFHTIDNVAMEAMTDILYMIPNTSENYPQNEVYYRQTYSRNSRLDESFSYSYEAINHINLALDFNYNRDQYRNNGKHPFDNISSSQQLELDRLLGELHFLRAFAYFNTVLRNCMPPGTDAFKNNSIIPLKESWSFDAEGNRHPSLASGDYIMKHIILPDLEKARELLPASFSSSNHPSYAIGRATKYAAYALSARVYFQLGPCDNYTSSWDSASLFAEQVIASGQYALENNPVQAFNRSGNTLSQEVLWDGLYYDEAKGSSPKDYTLLTWNKYSSTVADANNTVLFYNANDEDNNTYKQSHEANRCGWHVFCFSRSIMHSIGWIDTNELLPDATDEAKIDKRFQQLYIGVKPNDPNLPVTLQTGIIENKFPWINIYQVWCNKYFRGENGEFTNVPVIRLPEMYLLKAIIENRKGSDDLGLAEINTIRNRAGLSNLSSLTEKDVEAEWIKELAFEGHRYRYLVALMKPLEPGNRNAASIPWPYSDIEYTGGLWQLPLGETDFY